MTNNSSISNASQKMLLALNNSSLATKANIIFVEKWHQHIHLPDFVQHQDFEFQSTHNGQRVTLHHIGNTHEVFKTHTSYYQDQLKIDSAILQRLENVGMTWVPDRLGCWVELNTEGANAGWYLPHQISFNQLYQAFDHQAPKRKIINRWANLFTSASCIGYGESLTDPAIQQVELLVDPGLAISNQYHQALYLADFLQTPAFPIFLIEVLQTYDVRQLIISLWMTDEEVLKFGFRVLQPSNELLLALCMLAKFTDEDQEAIARMYGISEQVQWVEIQHTSSGLTAEMSFKV